MRRDRKPLPQKAGPRWPYDFSRLTETQRAALDALLARDDSGEALTEEEHNFVDKAFEVCRTGPKTPAPQRALSWGEALRSDEEPETRGGWQRKAG